MDNSSPTLQKYKSTFKKKEEPKEEVITDPEKRRQEKLAKERDSLLRKYYKKWILVFGFALILFNKLIFGKIIGLFFLALL